MDLSHRITTINGDGRDGWELFARARKMIADGIEVVELTIGDHDIKTDPSILAAMSDAARSGHTGYASIPGVEGLRRAIADRVTARTGIATGIENVVVTMGGQAGLFASHIAVCNPGDRALYCDPYYATYPGTIRSAGAVPVVVRTRPDNGFQPSVAELETHAKNASSLLINSPNNPTGVVYSAATMAGIAKVCKTHDLWLISDEVYDTQVWQGEHISPRTLPGMAERTLVIGSMSKSHAMTGSRIGWIIAPKDVASHLINLATNTTYGVPGFIQDAAQFALSQGPEFEAKIAEPFRRRLDIAKRVIAGQNVVRLVPPGGAMYAMLDIRATGLSGDEFANALLDREQIAVMPGESFGTCAAGHLRVALTVDDQKLENALNRLVLLAKEIAD